MAENGKGTYTLINKNDNFPDGKIDYDFNNVNGFSHAKVMKFLQETQKYMPVSPASDFAYNACLFALAANCKMEAVLSLPMSDFEAVSYKAASFFVAGLGAESESTTQAEITEKTN